LKGAKPPLDFENFSKKVVFLVSGDKKHILLLFASPRKILEKSPGGSTLEKILPTHMLAGMKESVSLSLQYMLPSSALFAKQFEDLQRRFNQHIQLRY